MEMGRNKIMNRNDDQRAIIKLVTGRNHHEELLVEVDSVLQKSFGSLNDKALDVLRHGFEQALDSVTPLSLAALNFEQFVKQVDELRNAVHRQALVGLEMESGVLRSVEKYIEQKIEMQFSRLLISGAKVFAAYDFAIESADAARKRANPPSFW
jgi:hypothetical protein